MYFFMCVYVKWTAFFVLAHCLNKVILVCTDMRNLRHDYFEVTDSLDKDERCLNPSPKTCKNKHISKAVTLLCISLIPAPADLRWHDTEYLGHPLRVFF